MTATDELRRMLDERGVEWTVPDESWNQDSITYWKVGNIKWVAFESENDTLWLNCNSVTDLTPEQAIAATLGSCNCSNNCTNGERTETCHMEQTGHVKVAGVDYYDDDYECSECGAEIFEGYNFCPMCGRRIEQ